MNYEFALDKKAVISLVAGWIFIAALLFLAGWVVGRQWPMSEAAAAPTATAGEQRAELPREPVLHDEAPTRELTAPKTVAPRVTPPAVTPPAAPKTTLPAATLAAAAPPPANDGKVVIISEAETDDANKPQAADPEYVTVQVGVFLDAKEANSLLQQMERKGYAPTFFSGRDAEARQWYAVRIGTYSDKEQATKAAANFTKQEKIKAVVRPAESL